ncbi:MAG TPA: phosphopantetheine-binding protein [Sporichthyaceae bacterium]|jgi:acyl carrier protein|nr:phosphopantetheine-binding protein [Sporichthyaceae bacterium]
MSPYPTNDEVLVEISAMLTEILTDLGPYQVEITMDTLFLADLDLESIDMVTLAGLLHARFGERINLAEFIAGKQVPELVSLTVGQLVEHITVHLATPEVVLR